MFCVQILPTCAVTGWKDFLAVVFQNRSRNKHLCQTRAVGAAESKRRVHTSKSVRLAVKTAAAVSTAVSVGVEETAGTFGNVQLQYRTPSLVHFY